MNPSEAFNAGIPAFGTWVLYAFLVTAAGAFGLSVAAATDRTGAAPRYLRAARLATLGTCALVALDVLLLLYAFIAHDFRIRYVAHYSDRSMPVTYLITALWGGQDGSLLWWTFLLALYTSAVTLWLKGRHRELAPYVTATLMAVVLFFAVMMAFAANPFSANVAGAPPDGEGLNPSLQNFYMAIHPPSLYTGFVGCAVPFAFAIAALLSGRLDEEWIRATRKWALFAWLFLSIGNTLGMLWAYEELGWGGYWAWDPVENAACMPWWTMTAYLHSVMIQERRGSLKVWNVSLVILTFLLTIFGTFLTRSGLIASIHSFAQSEIGVYFLYFLAVAIALSVALIARRWKQLRHPMQIDALLSREAMFVANNWLLLGICAFIIVATTWPKVSEWLWSERLTVGASFYNFWLPVPGLVLMALIGAGTLTPWRKASPALLWEAFRGPLVAFGVVALADVLFAGRLGYPAYVAIDPIYPSAVGRLVAKIDGGIAPVAFGLVAFNVAAVVQEFYRAMRARMRAKSEGALPALVRAVAKNRRRYGGYTVHVGLSLMFLGFTGGLYRSEGEASLRPGESFIVGRYTMRYDGTERRRDPNKTETIARVSVWRDGAPYTTVHPAKFVYSTHPESPTSEVSITPSPRDDLYVVMASVNTDTGLAHLKAFVNPLVVWIWIGGLLLVLGIAVAMWPEVTVQLAPGRLPAPPRAGGGSDGDGRIAAPTVTTRTGALVALVALGSAAVLFASSARAQGHSGTNAPPMVAGATEQMSPNERKLFDRLLCMCGDCQRLPLGTCTCDFAAHQRAAMRAKLADGETADSIVTEYVARFGAAALAVPPDVGHNRAVYALPLVALVGGAAVGVVLVRRWRARGALAPTAPNASDPLANRRADYDARLDQELRDLDD